MDTALRSSTNQISQLSHGVRRLMQRWLVEHARKLQHWTRWALLKVLASPSSAKTLHDY
jgi:hypothetical protein